MQLAINIAIIEALTAALKESRGERTQKEIADSISTHQVNISQAMNKFTSFWLLALKRGHLNQNNIELLTILFNHLGANFYSLYDAARKSHGCQPNSESEIASYNGFDQSKYKIHSAEQVEFIVSAIRNSKAQVTQKEIGCSLGIRRSVNNYFIADNSLWLRIIKKGYIPEEIVENLKAICERKELNFDSVYNQSLAFVEKANMLGLDFINAVHNTASQKLGDLVGEGNISEVPLNARNMAAAKILGSLHNLIKFHGSEAIEKVVEDLITEFEKRSMPVPMLPSAHSVIEGMFR